MNRLSFTDRARILHLLCEGASIRAVTRLTGASKNTVAKLLVDAGKACAAYHDEQVRNVAAKRVQVDEIWAFTHCKQKNVATATAASDDPGEVWTWTAIEADSKLVLSYLVSGRDAEYANGFMLDVAARLKGRVQLTADGLHAYRVAVEEAFGADVEFAQLVKSYGTVPDVTKGRYSPAECTGIKKPPVEGKLNEAHVSTSYVERQNLTMRMHMRRFTRITNEFSKKVENHAYAVALHFMCYNFVRFHAKLRVSPAMAAGVSDRLWEIGDIVALVEIADNQPRKRGPYKSKSNL